MRFSEEQERRLGALGATDEMLQADFPGEKERNRAYQRLESGLAAEQVQRLERFCEGPRRPLLLELEERLSAALRDPASPHADHPLPGASGKDGGL